MTTKLPPFVSALRPLLSALCLLTAVAALALAPQANAAVTKVAAGGGHSLYLTDDGTLRVMGSNYFGQLGDGTTTTRSVPVQIATGVIGMAAGGSHSLFVKNDGTLWAMGNNDCGQLGDGTTTNRSIPVQVATGVITVVAGNSHSLFLKSDGTLWAMGRYTSGQSGDGATTDRSIPVQIATSVIAVAAGAYHSLFVKSDGTLWAVGDNSYNQLGVGDDTYGAFRNAPVQVATGAIAVAAGYDHSLFLKSDGTLWAMGSNWYGQLGDGTAMNTGQSTPKQVAIGVITVAAGCCNSLFVKNDRTLWGMGANFDGELGDGYSRSTPAQITSDVITVAAGFAHTLFVKSDGNLWGMGRNDSGQLGDGGNRTYQMTPECIAEPRVPSITTQSASQTINVGQNTAFVIAANGIPAPTLQWQASSDGSTWTDLANNGPYAGSIKTPYTGVTTGTLTVSATDAALNGTQYRCVATNYAGSATSNAVTLTINYVPKITTQPATPQIIVAGATATFTITDAGNTTPAYQWQSVPSGSSAWKDISGAITATLTITNATTTLNGTQYRCVVTNSAGSATSNAATLYVMPDAAAVAAQAFKLQLEATGTATVTGTIDLARIGGATITSRKTIVGTDAASTITNGLIITTSASNTIILGVNFTGGTLAINGANDVTITNCTFTNAPVVITNGADNIAFAWNKFTATPPAAARDAPAMRIDNAGPAIGILLQDNLWTDGLLSDMPAVTNARVLMFNNYITATDNDTATIAGAGAQILSQNNIYQGTHNPLLAQDGGLLCALGNLMADTTGMIASGTDKVFVPAYSYTMLPADIVTSDTVTLADLVTACAGNTDGQKSETPAKPANDALRITGSVPMPDNNYPIGGGWTGGVSSGVVITGNLFNSGATRPVTTSVPTGGSFTLAVNATASTPASAQWQWYHDNFPIAGATASTYTVGNATATDAGAYSVTMTTADGEIVTSSAFTVTVLVGSGSNSGGNQTDNNDSNAGSGGGAPSLLWLCAIAALFVLRRKR